MSDVDAGQTIKSSESTEPSSSPLKAFFYCGVESTGHSSSTSTTAVASSRAKTKMTPVLSGSLFSSGSSGKHDVSWQNFPKSQKLLISMAIVSFHSLILWSNYYDKTIIMMVP